MYDEYVDNVMTSTPTYVSHNEMAVNALQIMNDKKITGMPVLDEESKVIGSILMQDIIRAGIVNYSLL